MGSLEINKRRGLSGRKDWTEKMTFLDRAERVAVNITLAQVCVHAWVGGSANTSGLKEATDLTDGPLSFHSLLLLTHTHISPSKWMELLNKEHLRGAVHSETELSETGCNSRHPSTFTHSHRLHMKCMSTSGPDQGHCPDHWPNTKLRIHYQPHGTGINSWNTTREETTPVLLCD